jgi:hypothetical protein
MRDTMARMTTPPLRVRRRTVLGWMLLTGVSAGAAALDTHVPYVPASDDAVLEHVTRASAADRSMRELRDQLARQPADLAVAGALAKADIALGNEEGDPRYFGYAQTALQPWWQAPDPPPEARLLRATIQQWQHRFDVAKQDLAAVIAADGMGVDQAHLTLANIELVEGDPAAARHDCVTLIGHTEPLIAATCIASANALMGHAAQAETSLTLAIAQSRDASLDAGIYTRTALADIAQRLGHDDAARRWYQEALGQMQQSQHRDPFLLASYADFLLDKGGFADVAGMLAGLERIDNLLLRLALAEAALGERGDAQMAVRARDHAADLERRFDETRQRGDFVHQRELAIYLLALRHDPAAALVAAAENWTHQRELIDARVYLEAAQAAGKPEAAAVVTDWIRKWHVEDVRLGVKP